MLKILMLFAFFCVSCKSTRPNQTGTDSSVKARIDLDCNFRQGTGLVPGFGDLASAHQYVVRLNQGEATSADYLLKETGFFVAVEAFNYTRDSDTKTILLVKIPVRESGLSAEQLSQLSEEQLNSVIMAYVPLAFANDSCVSTVISAFSSRSVNIQYPGNCVLDPTHRCIQGEDGSQMTAAEESEPAPEPAPETEPTPVTEPDNPASPDTDTSAEAQRDICNPNNSTVLQSSSALCSVVRVYSSMPTARPVQLVDSVIIHSSDESVCTCWKSTMESRDGTIENCGWFEESRNGNRLFACNLNFIELQQE